MSSLDTSTLLLMGPLFLRTCSSLTSYKLPSVNYVSPKPASFLFPFPSEECNLYSSPLPCNFHSLSWLLSPITLLVAKGTKQSSLSSLPQDPSPDFSLRYPWPVALLTNPLLKSSLFLAWVLHCTRFTPSFLSTFPLPLSLVSHLGP